MNRLTAKQQEALFALICNMDDCPGVYFGEYKHPHCPTNWNGEGEECWACVRGAVAALRTDQESPCAD